MVSAAGSKLCELMDPVVEHLGYELVGVEQQGQGRSQILRIYIDAVDGITVDDCARVSRQLSAMLDVESPLRGEYTLEVSSPGVDRILTKPVHFERFVGKKAKLRMVSDIDGRRNFSGYIGGLEGDELTLELMDGKSVRLPLGGIDKARLVPGDDDV